MRAATSGSLPASSASLAVSFPCRQMSGKLLLRSTFLPFLLPSDLKQSSVPQCAVLSYLWTHEEAFTGL